MSLISQIERNRVDPSPESLRYLAERLELPLEDLEALAREQRHSEAEVEHYKFYEELRVQAELALATNRPHIASGKATSCDRLKQPGCWAKYWRR
jgi:transcriptional regulator with XRE-family HTH domain